MASALQNEGIQFLSVDEAVAIHERLIERFGGTLGIRDKGLLESVLFRPQTGYYDDLAELAAALFESLILNHPFVDGNKRAAFFVTDTFLRLNGWKLSVETETAHTFIIGTLERGECDFDKLLPRIRESIVRTLLVVGVRGWANRFAIRPVGQLRWPRCAPFFRIQFPTNQRKKVAPTLARAALFR